MCSTISPTARADEAPPARARPARTKRFYKEACGWSATVRSCCSSTANPRELREEYARVTGARTRRKRWRPNGARSARRSTRRKCRSRAFALSRSTAWPARRDAVAADIANYAGSDLVCYRAGSRKVWPRRRATPGTRCCSGGATSSARGSFAGEGVGHVTQPAEALAAVRAEIGQASVRSASRRLRPRPRLTGSALLAFMLGARGAYRGPGRAAAHVDEDWNIRHWGEDADAMARRAARRAEFDAAAKMLALLRLR